MFFQSTHDLVKLFNLFQTGFERKRPAQNNLLFFLELIYHSISRFFVFEIPTRDLVKLFNSHEKVFIPTYPRQVLDENVTHRIICDNTVTTSTSTRVQVSKAGPVRRGFRHLIKN